MESLTLSLSFRLILRVGTGNPPGNCSEAKAVNAAHNNQSPITGMDTIWRGKGQNNYPYTGKNIGGKVERVYEQMNPCDTCANNENIKEYMNYANSKK